MKYSAMESPSSHNIGLAIHSIDRMLQSCDLLIDWHSGIESDEYYALSPAGVKDLAASCMLIEAIGEGVKKIDKLVPDFLMTHVPTAPWKGMKGMRDRMAHGYFEVDPGYVFDVAKVEMPGIRDALLAARAALLSLL